MLDEAADVRVRTPFASELVPCPCGSGELYAECHVERPLARCPRCGKPYHPRSKQHVLCGSSKSGDGCAGVRRRRQDAARKRRSRRGGPSS